MLKKLKTISNKNIILIIISIVFLWMLSGLLRSKEKIETADIVSNIQVKTKPSESQSKEKYLTFSGTSFAKNNIHLFTQVTGRVVKQFVFEGAILKAGDNIVEIQNDALIERVEQMKHSVQSAKLKYESIVQLAKQNLNSKLDVEEAKKNLNAAETDLIAAQTALQNTYITAPFNGRIDSIFIKEGDVVSNIGAGQSVIGRFIDLTTIEARAYLSQKERNEIKDSKEAIIIDSNNQSLNAKIIFIASSADDKTGTFVVKAQASNDLNLSDGEAIKLKIKVGEFKAHHIPISALIIDKDGDLSVKILSNNKIEKHKISIVDESENGIWISGIPDKCEIVLIG